MTKPNHRNLPIKIMTLNCGGLTPITETQIRNLISKENIHIILLQETKRTVRTETQIQTYTQAGHSIISLTHPNSQHGLQLWVNRRLSATYLPQYSKSNSHIEFLTVRLHYLIIVNIYRKHASIQPALNELDTLLHSLQQTYPNDSIILAGDYNATIIDTNSTKDLAKHKHFTNWFHHSSLTQISNNAMTREDPRTHKKTAIDHIFIKLKAHTVDEIYLSPFHYISSDHRPIILSLNKSKPQTTTWRPKFNWQRFYNQILNDVQRHQTPTIEIIQTTFLKYQRLHCPTQHNITAPRHWYKPTNTVRKLLKQAKTEKKYKDANYPNTKKKLRKALRADKTQQYKEYLKCTNREQNPRKFYTRLKYLKFPKPWNSDLAQGQEDDLLDTLNHDNQTTDQHTNSIKEKISKYFSDHSPDFAPFTIQDLLQVIKKLPTNKAPGWDGIPYEFWKQLPLPLKHHILQDINHIITTGNIPKTLSHTLIKPIQKTSTNSDPRPISLLPTITKIIEKLLKRRFQDWLTLTGTLAEEQFAYRPQHSAATQMHRLINNIHEQKNKHKKVALLSLDLSKAFDKVNTTTLLTQLIEDKAPSYLVQWMAETLLNRPIQVISTLAQSQVQTTSTGVLQGGTLAPLQFTYYINTIFKKHLPDTHSQYAFADDLAILCVSDTTKQLETVIQRSLYTLLKRLESLNCTVSLPKTKLITFNCRIPYLTYKNQKIHNVKQHKILGILLDKTLTFNQHVQHTITKATRSLNWLKSIAHSFHIIKRRTLAIQYVLSHLDYSLLAIYPFLSLTNCTKLNTVISKAARFILQAPHSVSTPFAITEAHLQNIHSRAIYLAIQHQRRHLNHTNPLCAPLAYSHQICSILETLDPQIDPLHTPLKTILQHLRTAALQTLSQHKPHLAKFITEPQKRLTQTTPLMTRLRTGHARTNQWLHRMKLIPPPPADFVG
jgi:exonuclease III